MYRCERCKGTGFLKKEDGTVEFCPCRFESIDENRVLRIPRRFWHAELENYEPQTPSQHRAITESRSFVETFKPSEGKGLTLIGEPGIGKTHIAVGVLKEIFRKKRVRGIFFDTKDLLYTMKMLIDEKRDMKLLKSILGAKLIVLDDLGSERLSDWQREILSYIISYRYNNLKSTIITSNYRLRELKGENDSGTPKFLLEDRLGANVVSRIYEMTKVILIKGEDRRILVKS